MPGAIAVLKSCALLTLLLGAAGAILLGLRDGLALKGVYIGSLLFLSLILAAFLYGFAANLDVLHRILNHLEQGTPRNHQRQNPT